MQPLNEDLRRRVAGPAMWVLGVEPTPLPRVAAKTTVAVDCFGDV